MRVFITVSAAMFAGLVLAGTASAADCTSLGDPTAVRVYPPADMASAVVLGLGAVSTAMPETVKRADRSASCSRGALTAGGQSLDLSGENGDAIPRKAVSSAANGVIVYLAAFQDATATVLAEINKQPPPPPLTRFALVVIQGDIATVKRVYSAVPPDDMLKAEIAAALPDPIAIASVDQRAPKPSLFIASGSTPPPPRPGPPPPPGRTVGPPVVLRQPDGVVFKPAVGDAIVHAATGLVCPVAINGRPREAVVIFDFAEQGRDVSCHYGRPGEASWFTLYATKLPGQSAKEVFRAYVAEAQSAAPSRGGVAAPLRTGRKPLPEQAAFWLDAQGTLQGLWTTHVGDWHIKLRATYQQSEKDAVKAMAQTVFKSVAEQVTAPAS